MRDTIDEMTKPTPLDYAQAVARGQLQIRLNKARGCAILFFHINERNQIELLVIGEQTASGVRFGFIGGKQDIRMKTVYRADQPDNPQLEDCVGRPELPHIAATREFMEESGGRLKFTHLVYPEVYVGVYDKPNEDSTEVVFAFLVNELAYKEMLELPEQGRTVYKGWWTLEEIYANKDFRPGDLNGLDDVCIGIMNIHSSHI